jgi:hypothetical protein
MVSEEIDGEQQQERKETSQRHHCASEAQPIPENSCSSRT